MSPPLTHAEKLLRTLGVPRVKDITIWLSKNIRLYGDTFTCTGDYEFVTKIKRAALERGRIFRVANVTLYLYNDGNASYLVVERRGITLLCMYIVP